MRFDATRHGCAFQTRNAISHLAEQIPSVRRSAGFFMDERKVDEMSMALQGSLCRSTVPVYQHTRLEPKL